MKKPSHRFWIYAVSGLIFGVFDWFYLGWLANFPWGSLGQSILVIPVILVLNYGIWLVPVIPVVLHESRGAVKPVLPAVAGALTWSGAMVGYYGYYAALLALGKLPNLEHLRIFGEKDDAFWIEFWNMFDRVILGQFLEWIVIAVLGGAILGLLAYGLQRRRAARARKVQQPAA